ncbi:MAG: DMT family transporter [Myxococcota bacterium]|nr:DMT family transporter [Myxococcota bacterium]
MFSSHIGEIAALGTAICWTATSMAFESAGKRVGSMAVNLIRLCMALILLSLFCLATRGHLLPTDATPHAWLWLSISGVIGFTIGDLCLFRAFVVIGSRISMLLMALVPPFTALIGWILMNERLALFDWIGMALTVGGVVWVIRERPNRAQADVPRLSRSGILLGIGGAGGQAVGLVFSKFGMADYDPFAATQIRIIAGIVGFAGLFLAIGWWPRVIAALSNRQAMARTSIGAVFGPFLGVSLSLLAVKHTEAGVAATLMALVPVLIIPPAVIIQKERVTPRGILGAIIAVIGAALLFV